MGNIHIVGPNEALIVSGGCCGTTQKEMIIGNWAWEWWLLSDVQRLSLGIMTLTPTCEQVETAQGVSVTVTGVAQCKVMTEREFLAIAAEQFLGTDVKHVKTVISQTLEGHLRAILGKLTVEEIYHDRYKFTSLVREIAAPDLGRMGIEILSFSIKDVVDDVDYLDSLGRSRAAIVKRDANVGMADAERDAGIREAECQKSTMDVKYASDTKIEDSHRMFSLEKSNCDAEVNTKKAETELSYELQTAKLKQKIRNEEIEIDVVERRKQIAIQEKEILRKEKELMGTVRLPAEAEAYKVEIIANGHRTQTMEVAKAEAERTKMMGAAEAYAIEAVGKAEAEQMRMKADAFQQFGDAAVMSLVLEALPKITAEVAAPLGRTEDIIMLGGEDRITSEVAKLITQLPPAVQSLTGVDVTEMFKKRFVPTA